MSDLLRLRSSVLERLLDIAGFREVRIDVLSRVNEKGIELLATPLKSEVGQSDERIQTQQGNASLNGVLDSVREILNSARWRLLLRWILRRAVGFCQVRNNHLSVALGPQCP